MRYPLIFFTALMLLAGTVLAQRNARKEEFLRNLQSANKYREAALVSRQLIKEYQSADKLQFVNEKYHELIGFYKKLNELDSAAYFSKELGDWFYSLGKNYWTDAHENYSEAIKLYSQTKNRIELARIRIIKADLYDRQHITQKAIDEYEKAYTLAKGKNEELEKTTSYKLRELYKIAGNTEMSQKYDEIYESFTFKIVETLKKNDDSLKIKEQEIQELLQLKEQSPDSIKNAEEYAKVQSRLKKLEEDKERLEQSKQEIENKLKTHKDEISALELYKKNKEIKEQKDFEKQIFLVTTGGLILLFLLTFALIQRNVTRRVKAQNAQLEQMNEEVSSQNEQLQKQYEQIRQQNQEIEKKNLEIEYQKSELEVEKRKSDQLLLNILPVSIAEELKEHDRVEPKTYEMVTVLFTDFKGFTQVAERLSPRELVEELNECFTAFDDIIKSHNLEKIKTIGDAYMCAGGLPERNNTNPVDAILAALEMQRFMQERKQLHKILDKPVFELRLGIHTGPIIAGVVGINKFAYDIWGDTVNTASRMESSSEPGKVNVSGVTQALTESYFHFTYRGKVQAKNKGAIDMYFVDGIIE